MIDHGGWRLLGLNTQICGTDPAEEAAQAGLIDDALAGLGERRLAVFLHKPIFTTTPEDSLFDYWSVPPSPGAPSCHCCSTRLCGWWPAATCIFLPRPAMPMQGWSGHPQ